MSETGSRPTMNGFLGLAVGLTLATSVHCARKSPPANPDKLVCPGNQHKLETNIKFEKQNDGTCKKTVAPEPLCINKAEAVKHLRWHVTSTCDGEQAIAVTNFSPDSPLDFPQGPSVTVTSQAPKQIHAKVKGGMAAGKRTYDVTRNGVVDSDPEVMLADEP